MAVEGMPERGDRQQQVSHCTIYRWLGAAASAATDFTRSLHIRRPAAPLFAH
jgi:IS30 family transposase